MRVALPATRALAIEALHEATAIYTREPIVDQLLDAVDWPSGLRRLVDPSCGDGVVVGRALERLLAAKPLVPVEKIADVLQGWELHPGAVACARQRIAAILVVHRYPADQAAAVAEQLIVHADFLTQGPTESTYDVVVGNPPYLRWTNIPDVLREEYAATLPRHASADLLHAFLDRCASVLTPDGEIALVTADRWLFNLSAGKLRQVIGRRLGIGDLYRLDAATAFYRAKTRRAGTLPRVHPVAVVLRPRALAETPLTAAPVFPDRVAMVGTSGPVLGDLARISLSPWLGPRGIFVVDREIAAALPPECLVPAVDSGDIDQGRLKAPSRYALKTCPEVPPSPAVQAHLRANLQRMPKRGQRKTWWMPPESFHLRSLDEPCLMIPRIARSLRPVFVPAGILVTDHHLTISASESAPLSAIESLLCSPEANEWIQAHAARLESGFFALSARLLRQLPAG